MNWERLWHSSGIGFVLFLIVAVLMKGRLPSMDASPEAVASFYEAHRARILLAAVISGLGLLNLVWFAAALTTTLRAAGQGGWGTAVTAASALMAGMFFVLIALIAALAYAATGTAGDAVLASQLHRIVWATFVVSAFPRAMLTMAPTFGLWRARLISNAFFAAGVGAVILGVLGGMMWARQGAFAPDGVYSRLVLPIIEIVWTVVISGVVLRVGRTEEHTARGEHVEPMRPALAGEW
jgi:hypothetical protein